MEREQQIRILAGTKFKISTKGYYDYWYPSEEDYVFEHDVSVETFSSQLKFSKIAGWVPYKVSREVANLYGSPIQVLWVERGKKNV